MGNTSTVFCSGWFVPSEDILTKDETDFCILVYDLIIKIQTLLDTVDRLVDETKCNNEDKNSSIFSAFLVIIQK